MKYLYCNDCGMHMGKFTTYRNCHNCLKLVKQGTIFTKCQRCNKPKIPSIWGLCDKCKKEIKYANDYAQN